MTNLIRIVALIYLLAASTTHVPGQLLAPWFGNRYAPRPQQQFCPPEGCPQQPQQPWGWPQQDPAQQQAPPADLSTQVQLPANVQQSIVRVANADRVGNERSLATGTVIESNEGGTIVLTCAHLVDRQSSNNFVVYFPNAQHSPATLVDIDPALDLAAFHVPVQNVPVVPVAANPPNQGDGAYFAGYGGQGQLIARRGRTTQYVTIGNSGPPDGAIEVTGGARSGDSGGPILNEACELVGVISCSNGAEVQPGARQVSVQKRTETRGPVTMGTCCRHFPGFLQRMRARIAARRGHQPQSNQRPADVAPQPPADQAAPLTPPLVQVPEQPAAAPQHPLDDERAGLLARTKQLVDELRDRDTLIDRLRGEKAEGETERKGLLAKVKEHAAAILHRDRQVEGLGATIKELREKSVAAVETSLLTKILIASGIVSPPLAGIAAGMIVFVARKRGKKLREQVLSKATQSTTASPTDHGSVRNHGSDCAECQAHVARLEAELANATQQVVYASPSVGDNLPRMRRAMKQVSDYYPAGRVWVKLFEEAYTLILSGEKTNG